MDEQPNTESSNNGPPNNVPPNNGPGVEESAGDESVLAEAGARLRGGARSLDPTRVRLAVAQHRARRRGRVAATLAVLVVLLGATLAVTRKTSNHTVAATADGANVDHLLASLPPEPVDPTHVRLVSSVQTYPGCASLIDDLRTVGAKHVGSRGFGEFGQTAVGYARGATQDLAAAPSAQSKALGGAAPAPATGATTLGTNVQVAGVDELDNVKAEGSLIYDLDGKGNLRITDAATLAVRSTLAVATANTGAPGQPPGAPRSLPGSGNFPQASALLVSDGHVVVFGSEADTSAPVPGDPSASQSVTNYLTLVFVDATDPVNPKVTDRVKVDGSLVAARLVGGQVRLVTTSHMADIGFVLPTTPASIPTALERNRRSVATSTVAEWIPEWQRPGGPSQPLVPCDRVNVPTTFAGVAMTSMVTFPIGVERFAPAATSILAPATTLYAGTDKVAISSEVWVDPADRQNLKFDDWKTAIHEFTFAAQGPPTYVGSGIVDGSTVGQFAFGEVGDSIAVVSARGTPWAQDSDSGVDLTLLTPDSKGGLAATSKVSNLSGGKGQVTAVRYLDGRVLVATGLFGQDVEVLDVTNPAAPRRAGHVALPGPTGYFHPLPAQRALLVGSRADSVPGPRGPLSRPWVDAELLDVSDAHAPKIVESWEVPWANDAVGQDHHAFTYWPDRKLAMWGVSSAQLGPNHAVVLDVADGVKQAAWPVASEPPAVPPPCPQVSITDPQLRQLVGQGAVVLGCASGSRTEVDWPRYQCNSVPAQFVTQYAPDEAGKADYFICSPAPPPTVSRVLVVAGRPILMTDQTLEALDPTTFAPVEVVYHPT